MLNRPNYHVPLEILALAGALLFLTGCDALSPFSSSYEPEWLVGSEAVPEGLALTLEAPDEVSIGEPVPLQMTLQNNTDEDVVLYVHGRDGFDRAWNNFFVSDRSAEENIWSAQHYSGAFTADMPPRDTLKAGERVTYEGEWMQAYGQYEIPARPPVEREDAGEQVPPGTYEIYGSMFFGLELEEMVVYRTPLHTLSVVE